MCTKTDPVVGLEGHSFIHSLMHIFIHFMFMEFYDGNKLLSLEYDTHTNLLLLRLETME